MLVMYLLFEPGGLLSSTELGHLISLFINLNSIKVQTEDNLEKDKVKIYWDAYQHTNILIFEKGKKVNRIQPCYGGNLFTVYYNNKIKEILQSKKNNWHYHKYIFTIYGDKNDVKAKLKIIGPDNHIL
jgi:hypothetical protein